MKTCEDGKHLNRTFKKKVDTLHALFTSPAVRLTVATLTVALKTCVWSCPRSAHTLILATI
jgi:hypothetical protein